MSVAASKLMAEQPLRRVNVRGRLFRKYVGLFVAVVCLALFANGLFEIWFSYQEHKTALIRIQREQAEAAAAKIGQFVKEIEGQLGWTVQLPWSASTLEQRRSNMPGDNPSRMGGHSELRQLIDLRSKPNYHAPSYHDEQLDLSHASVPPQGNSPLAGDGRIATH